MTIAWQTTADALASAINSTDAGSVRFAAGGSTTRAVSLEAELADAKNVLQVLRTAASAYTTAQTSWASSYTGAARLLDRRSRFVLSLTTSAPASISVDTSDATHTAIVARADAAAGSAAPATALADLLVYRTAFNTSWSSKPSDAGAEGVALTAALVRANACIEFLSWARSDA